MLARYAGQGVMSGRPETVRAAGRTGVKLRVFVKAVCVPVETVNF